MRQIERAFPECAWAEWPRGRGEGGVKAVVVELVQAAAWLPPACPEPAYDH